ncbi:MAG: hypothetical protein ABSH50_12625 [Bryobacteraceae bacterium]|jgi:hypothetical protein
MGNETKAADAPGCFYCLNVKPFVRHVWSEATKDHFRNSRVEFLKGLRSIIDERISHMAQHEAKGTRVTVE